MAKTEIRAEASLDTTKFQRGIAKANKSVKNFAKSAGASFLRMGAAFAGVGLVKSIVQLGLSAGETASKFEAVFGPAADSMNKKVQDLRETIPATTAEMQNALSTFAAMAKGFGLNTDAANLFSVEMVKIAGDISSFHDLPIEEAFGKIRSAVSGEFEPLKQLGIVINEARLKQEGLSLAIWDGTGQMSAAQKALAVQSIMIRDMGDANGDAALTADSAANKVKFLQKKLKETGTEIGTTTLPAIVSLVGAFAAIVNGAKGAAEAVGKFVGELAFEGASSGRQEIEDQVRLRKKVIEQLKEEGKIRKESPMFSFSKKSREANLKEAKIIEDRMAAINAEKKAKIKADEDAAAAKNEASEQALKDAKDLKGEIEKQIEAEKDPARKKALEDRLAAYQRLIEAAGKLNSMQGIKPGGGTGGSAAAASTQVFDPADANKSGIVTGREQRAQESAQRKSESEARRAKTLEVAMESGAGERARIADRNRRFDIRESTSGLSMNGGDMSAQKSGKAEEEAIKQTGELEKLNKTIGRLESAIGN